MTSAPPPHVLARYDFISYCSYMQPGYIVANHARVLAAALERVAAVVEQAAKGMTYYDSPATVRCEDVPLRVFRRWQAEDKI